MKSYQNMLPSEESKRTGKLLKEAARSISSRPSMPCLGESNKLVKGVVAENKNVGKKMMKVGAALILMPEPVTSAAGVPMVLLGRAISSKTGTNIKGVYEELEKTLRSLTSV